MTDTTEQEISLESAAALLLAPEEQPEETEAEVTQEAPEVSEETVDEPDDAPDETASDDEAETESADQEQPQSFTVKVDGKEISVTLDDLKRSYSGQAYIQQGMQQAAAAKKEAETLAQTLQAERQQLINVVSQLQQTGIKAPPAEPDMEMLNKDPIGYIQDRARYEAEMKAYVAQQEQLRSIQDQASQAELAQRAEFVRGQAEILKQRIPAFADPQKAKELQAQLASTAVEGYGFSAEEVAGITDARAVQVLHDAAQWRALQAGKAMAKKAPEAPRTVKPVARAADQVGVNRQKQLQQAKRTGKVEDFVGLLFK